MSDSPSKSPAPTWTDISPKEAYEFIKAAQPSWYVAQRYKVQFEEAHPDWRRQLEILSDYRIRHSKLFDESRWAPGEWKRLSEIDRVLRHRQPETSAPNRDENVLGRESIAQALTRDPNGCITYRQAAVYFSCTTKTIRRWTKKGKLKKEPKRSGVTNASVIKLKPPPKPTP